MVGNRMYSYIFHLGHVRILVHFLLLRCCTISIVQTKAVDNCTISSKTPIESIWSHDSCWGLFSLLHEDENVDFVWINCSCYFLFKHENIFNKLINKICYMFEEQHYQFKNIQFLKYFSNHSMSVGNKPIAFYYVTRIDELNIELKSTKCFYWIANKYVNHNFCRYSFKCTGYQTR